MYLRPLDRNLGSVLGWEEGGSWVPPLMPILWPRRNALFSSQTFLDYSKGYSIIILLALGPTGTKL